MPKKFLGQALRLPVEAAVLSRNCLRFTSEETRRYTERRLHKWPVYFRIVDVSGRARGGVAQHPVAER